MGLKNTHKKTELGLRLWDGVDPDFMLLRFPAVDIMSHKYFATVRDEPEFNPMVEVIATSTRCLVSLLLSSMRTIH